MVSVEELKELFEYRDGELYGREVPWRRPQSNSRVVGKALGTPGPQGYKLVGFQTQDKVQHFWLVHRAIFYMHYGYLPKLIDHIDRDSTNNKIENLRSANNRINAINSKTRCNNTSGFVGVVWCKSRKKWVARINLPGSRIQLGRFRNLEDAVKARKDAEVRYGYDLIRTEATTQRETTGDYQEDSETPQAC